MADEIALNLMKGFDQPLWSLFMFTRSTGFPSGNWSGLKVAFSRTLVDGHQFTNKDYYVGRPYIPIAGKSLIKWSE